MDLLSSTMLSTPFLLSVTGAACVGGALVMSWIISTKAQFEEADYREKQKRIPAAAADEVVVERLRLHREELKEVEDKLAGKKNEFSEAKQAEKQAEHWQEMVRKLKADYAGLEREKKEIDEIRDAYTKAASELAETRTALEDNRASIERLRIEEADLARRVQEQGDKIAEGANLEDRVRVLKAELDTVRAELAGAKDEREDMMFARVRLEDLRGQIVQMQHRHDELVPLVEQMSTRIGELKAEASELEALSRQRSEIMVELERLQVRRSELTESVERTERHLEDAQKRHDELVPLVEQMSARIGELKAQASELETLSRQRGEITIELDRLQVQRGELRELVERAEQRHNEMQRELQAQSERFEETQDSLRNLRREIAELEPTRDEHRRLVVAVEQLTARHRVLEALIAEREMKLPREGEDKAGGGVDASLADLVRRPSCLFHDDKPILASPNKEKDEIAMLAKVKTHLDQLGLVFDDRLLRRFHTSLKTGRISPLTVLAGISGTGKSQLPQRYAEAMGINFLKVPVQPRWDSPQDLFGFYNYLERRYKATEFARALVHMERHGQDLVRDEFRMRDRVLLVLLDEMNLARVEYYFSEFLSRLEGRPDANVNDEAILRPSRIEIEVGSDHERHQSVYPGHNVIYVGTMNQDESTQSLSDKVLDRANTIRFPRPKALESGKSGNASKPTEQYLPFDTWLTWCRDINKLPPELERFAADFVGRLNAPLERLKRPYGHRVNQAILSYVVNHPNYQTMAGVKEALVDMLEMRVLPKLRGVELNEVASSAFSAIASMVQDDLGETDLAAVIRNGVRDADIFDWTGMPQK